MKARLTTEDFRDDAARLNCSVAAVMAVCAVESKGRGFDDQDRPIILFEAHIFNRYTKGKYLASHPLLASANWNRKLYSGSNDGEHGRLQEACVLDRTAALMSTSWGLFQVMGFNFGAAGHKTLQLFVNAMHTSENLQLEAFTNFVLNNGLDDELAEQRWSDFARKYNGPGFADNKYDTKLAKAYDKYVKLGHYD